MRTGEVEVGELGDVSEALSETSRRQSVVANVQRQQRVDVVEQVVRRRAHQPVTV